MSNYLEHLDSGDAVIEQLRVAARAAASGRPADRAAAEHPARRAALLGLHRPPRRADRPEPARGGRARRPSDRRAHHRASCRTRRRAACRRRRSSSARTSRFPPAWRLLGKQTLYVGTPADVTVAERSQSSSIVMPVYNEGEAVEPVLRALSAGVATPHEIVVVYDFDGDTTVPVIARLAAEIAGASRAAQRPRSRRPQRDEGRDRRNDRAVRAHLDGRRLGRAPRRRPDGRARREAAPTSSPPRATCGAAGRSAGRRSSGC